MSVKYDAGKNTVAVTEAHDILVDAGGGSERGPLTCRWPEEGPVRGYIVFCHGLGSSRRGYESLSRTWASHGYLVIHPTFDDSIYRVAQAEPGLGLNPADDLSNWTQIPHVRARLHEILHSPDRWIGRVRRVDALMDALPSIFAATTGQSASGVPGVIAGHSFGAYTTQLLAGAEIDMPDGEAMRFKDPRFQAAIILSGQGRDQQGLREGSWDDIDMPLLNVTGTRDQGAKGGDWHWKTEPYEFAPAGGKYLAVLEDTDHYLGGMGTPQYPAQFDAVAQLTLAFLDAHLAEEPAARAWLAEGKDHVGACPLLFRSK